MPGRKLKRSIQELAEGQKKFTAVVRYFRSSFLRNMAELDLYVSGYMRVEVVIRNAKICLVPWLRTKGNDKKTTKYYI